MKFDTRVMAHPSRKQEVIEFCEKHGISYDRVSYDNSGSALNGARKAWLAPFDGDDITHRIPHG